MKGKNGNGQRPPIGDHDPGIAEPESREAVQKPSRAEKRRPGPADPLAREEEQQLDFSLRPRSLAEFVGQKRLKQVLGMSIEAARKRGEALDHVLFSAPPGLGKTSLAHIIARELGVNLRITSGPAIERAGDLAAIVSDLDQGDVLFIDEIHRLARVVEEILYPAMEDFELNIGDGGLRAQYCRRPGAGCTDHEACGQAVHNGRRDDPLGPSKFSPT